LYFIQNTIHTVFAISLLSLAWLLGDHNQFYGTKATIYAHCCSLTGKSLIHEVITIQCQNHKLSNSNIQSVPVGKVNIQGGHSNGHSKQKSVYIYTCVLFQTVSKIELLHCTVHCTDEQHTMSSHELQSAFMLTVEF
jgi:hypothetical protein